MTPELGWKVAGGLLEWQWHCSSVQVKMSCASSRNVLFVVAGQIDEDGSDGI